MFEKVISFALQRATYLGPTNEKDESNKYITYYIIIYLLQQFGMGNQWA